MTLTGVVGVLNFADVGIGLGMQNRISEAHGQDNMELARKVFLTGFALLAIIALAIFGVGLLVGWHFDWASFFKIETPEVRPYVREGLFVVFMAFCIGFPLSAAQKLAVALQLGWLQAIGTLLGSIISLILVAVAASLKLSLVPFLAVAVLPPVLINLGLMHRLMSILRWRFDPLRHLGSDHVRAILGTGSLFILPQLASVFLHAMPPVILSSTIGAAAVGPFNITQRLFGVINQIHGMLLYPLWPAYAEARSRGDEKWVRDAFRKSIIHTLWAVPLPFVLLALIGRPVILFWTHSEDVLPTPLLLCLLAAWLLLLAIGAPAMMLLNGLSKLKGQSTYFLISAFLSVVLMPMFAERFGAPGIPAALILPYVLIALPCLYFEATFALRKQNAPRPDPDNQPA